VHVARTTRILMGTREIDCATALAGLPVMVMHFVHVTVINVARVLKVRETPE